MIDGLQRRNEYLNAKPFPHIVLDDFLQAEHLFPRQGDATWKKTENKHTAAKSVTKTKGFKWESFGREQKAFFAELSAAPFLKFLEDLTGIEGLMADPYFIEGGFHMVGNGGRLGIHADFSHHPKLGLERRVNLLLYLNKNWQKDYGGALRLYNSNVEAEKEIEPINGRCVIFSTSDQSYHGHPDPMKLPNEVVRKSLALYYYSLPTGREKRNIFFPQDPKFTR